MTNNPTANGPCRYHGNNTARETDSGAKSAGAGIIAARLSDLERNSATRRQRAGADSPPKAAGDRRPAGAAKSRERGSEIPLPLPCRRRSAMDYDPSA